MRNGKKTRAYLEVKVDIDFVFVKRPLFGRQYLNQTFACLL